MSTFEQRLRDALSPAYDIERELTGGGMSRVFVATERALGRRVVIKVLPPELTAGVNRDRFRREVQVAAQLQHPHIVTLLSAGEDGDILYYTMPYIEGESLRVALEKGPLAVKDVVRILHDVVDALAYAHARGVIHRDIKPGNILRQGAHALVTDFGVAKALNAAMPASGITSAGMAIGTPAYMAPEQLAGDPASDHRIDIYAVGLLAYELLTGESPFTGPSPQATMAAQLTRDPDPLFQVCPDVPPPLSAIIMQCLAKIPAERPPTAEALMSALDAITTASGDVRTGATPILPAVRRRRRSVTIAGGVATVALASAVAVFGLQRSGGRAAGVEPARDTASATRPAPEETGTGGAATASAAANASPAVAAPVPVVLTRQDSLAIAEAVRKRLAEEEADKGTRRMSLFADSITAYVRKLAIDSIIKATLPAGVPVPAWTEHRAPPAAPPVPPAVAGTRRVVITEPRESRRTELNVFGRALVDSLRRAMAARGGHVLVSQDSVRSALEVSRARADIERTLKPDLIISPTFAGAGDTMTVLVTLRNVGGRGPNTRIASGKFVVSDPAPAIPALVKLVLTQLDDLHRAQYRVVVPKPVVQGRRVP